MRKVQLVQGLFLIALLAAFSASADPCGPLADGTVYEFLVTPTVGDTRTEELYAVGKELIDGTEYCVLNIGIRTNLVGTDGWQYCECLSDERIALQDASIGTTWWTCPYAGDCNISRKATITARDVEVYLPYLDGGTTHYAIEHKLEWCEASNPSECVYPEVCDNPPGSPERECYTYQYYVPELGFFIKEVDWNDSNPPEIAELIDIKEADYPATANTIALSHGGNSLIGSGVFNSLVLLVIPVGGVVLMRILRRRR